MDALPVRAAFFAAALLLCLYLPHAALDLVRRARAKRHSSPWGWLLGGAASWGTGLWAAALLTLLACHAGLDISHDAALLLASWLVSAGAAFGMLAAASVTLPSWRQWLVISGGLACGLGVVLGLILVSLQPVNPWAGAWAVSWLWTGALLMASALLVGFVLTSEGLLRLPAWHGAVSSTVAAAALMAVFALTLAGEVSSGAPDSSLGIPSTHAALLAGVGALLALAATRFMSRIERHLVDRADGLEQSLRQANSDLHRIAYHDALTQLPNRLVFEDKLVAAVARADRSRSRLAVLFIDLDGFKPINDSLGHSSGDAVLRQVGERLRGLSRSADTMARVGGDEFLMLLEDNPDEQTAAQVAARMLAALGQPYALGSREMTVSCSIGIVFYPDGGAHTKLIARADAAMYAAKRSGGACYCFFEPSMEADAHDQLDLQRDLRVALENKELELFYQPKVDARSGKVTAAEALLRWKHPQRGMIGPATFIPVAERFGLIGTLGNWVIEDACRQARAWRDKGLRMRVAINLSAIQMRQDDLVERITTALNRHRIDPSLLTCEITESVAMEDTRATQTTFRRLGEAGVHLSIDDFGTGYSSLGYLRKLPAEELKIDRSFVMDIETSVDARAVVDAVIHLAHALGLKVVAEGVENERQRDILIGMGCDELQGYLFAKPMSARALLLWASDDQERLSAFKPSLFGETKPVAANEGEVRTRAAALSVAMSGRRSGFPETVAFPDTVPFVETVTDGVVQTARTRAH
ncbi:putative bifunctional diguanylate cyclase/phosphodiesterase [Piscinibacter sp.]|uniref:putative bifunctional diguanylate cyclase/phosphodiesterase n=1 Tax=Piscinibacter sp. TaxID=1903157 RepID=UPI002F425C0F